MEEKINIKVDAHMATIKIIRTLLNKYIDIRQNGFCYSCRCPLEE